MNQKVKKKANPTKEKVGKESSVLWNWVGCTLFIVCFLITFCRQVNFSAADLGRHIKNGEVLFSQPKVLFTNLYSYTQPNFPFVNHHWLAGSIFFIAYNLTGFSGLHILFALVMAGAMGLLYFRLKENTNWQTALFLGLLLLPALAFRREIRPEGFSYLLFMVWFSIISKRQIPLKDKLIIGGIIQLIWVNTHIFFFIGPMVTAFFIISSLVVKEDFKDNLKIFVLQIALCLANPNFLNGALSPLTIFNHYGYMVSENQSIFFMQNRFGLSGFLHIFLITFILFLGLVWLIIKKKWNVLIPEILLAFSGIAMGFLAIRGFTYLGISVALIFKNR
jgi:hypothetical protein